jgi:hypothetical protein
MVGWGNQDDRESIAAIRYAVENGVNWIDTAAIYAPSHSAEIVAAEDQSTAVRRGTRSRPCGRRKSSSGPTGTIRVGLIDVWL